MSIIIDTYTKEFLIEQYNIHKSYVLGRLSGMNKFTIKIRLPSIPEDISENIIKFIIQNKNNDITSSWNCGVGDLLKYGKILKLIKMKLLMTKQNKEGIHV